MNYDGFIGQTYVSSTPSVDCEECQNLFPEIINGPGITPKSRFILRRRAGLNLLQTLGDNPGRGKYSINGRDFAVVGGSFFELLTPTTSVLRGSIPYGTSAVQMKCNTVQVGLLADGLLYMFNLGTNTFLPVTGQDGLPAYCVSLDVIDTYFLILGQSSNEFGISTPLDGTQWSGLDFGSSEEPDNAVAIAQLHLYLWIFGQQETIIFQDSGNANFPFTRVQGSQIEQGCGAVDSPCIADNTLFWLGSDARGPAIAYRADGFLPTRVSTHAVEEAWQSYPTTSDCSTYPYQENGHLFVMWHFPSANGGVGATWGYDIATGMWHKRGAWNTGVGEYTGSLERFHSFCFGKHVVADWTSGNIYEMSTAFATDNGAPIRWLRAAPNVSDDGKWLFFAYFQVDMQTGGGLPNGATPVVMVRWSDDGGSTWCTPREVSCGATGKYGLRVRSNRNGRSRSQRVYEISGTDPIPELVLMGASLGVKEGLF
jgi:hypothetical protein